MKKFLVLFLLFSLCACSVPKKEVEPVITETPVSSETAEPVIDIDTDHHLDGITAHNYWNLEGDATYISDVKKQIISLKTGCEAYLSIDEVYLLEGTHTITSQISIDGSVKVMIEILDDEDNVIFEKEASQEVLFENDRILYSARIRYHFIPESDSEVVIENFMINRPEEVYMIRANQVGYKNDSRKVAYFKSIQGNYFDVVNKENNEVVMSFGIGESLYYMHNAEYIAKGDFTDLNVDGTYYLRSSLGYVSYDFNIGDNVYDELYNDSLRMLTIQRCDFEVNDELSESMAHEVCHDRDAIIETTKEMIDVRGGWHDAGDYGRYIETGVKALSDLLIAFISNEEVFTDNENLVDSNNGIPDILDEARYELDWFMKMQRSDGAIYSRAVTKLFADAVLPEDDTDDIYVLQVSTSSSAGFGAVMALASVAFKEYDEAYAQMCLDKAKMAYKYVSQSGPYNPALPAGFSAGDYALADENIYRYYLGIALWFATDDNSYLEFANKHYSSDMEFYSVYWCPLMAYPSYLFLLKGNDKLENYQSVESKFYNYVNYLLDYSNKDGYRNSLYDNYRWGSNQNVADRAMILLMAYELDGTLEYYDVASEYLSYLLGANTLNYCFVSGYGSQYPQNIHHRITMVNGGIFKGALVGGPNASLDDEVIRKQFEGGTVLASKAYIDDKNSYSTNEIAIHFNSSLIYVLSYFK